VIPDVRFIEEVARAAGELLRGHWGRLEAVEKKGARDLVTVADRESEALIVSRVRDRYPDHAVLAEEEFSEAPSTWPCWVIDPLDGTTNFVHRVPHVAVSIAWCDEQGVAVGCVYNPILDECYTATRGGGARLDGEPIGCSATGELSEALLATGFHYRLEFHPDSNLQHFVDLATRVRGIRRLGAAACDLCYVADGRFDGFWEPWLEPWDVAAGGLVAREAGCVVTDFDGGDQWLFGRRIVAANPALAPRIREVLAAADPASLPGPAWEPPRAP